VRKWEPEAERRFVMPRLTWGDPGERYFEAGVDLGVLYPPVGDGVAWSGLISVDESPSGGEARPFYQDGIKYLNLSSAEEFAATINAFAAPLEFNPCDGIAGLQNGLFATQQPRKPFGLSYRTQVGNDLVGVQFAYKIHLVYNALAAPSQRTNSTQTDSPQPTTLSWAISTLPPAMTGVRPTAHLVIDSRYATTANLNEVEDLIYGSPSAAARLPTPAELIAIFAS